MKSHPLKSNLKKIFFTLSLSFCLIGISSAQTKFQHVYAPNGDVVGQSVFPTPDRGYLTLTSFGYVLSKVDSNGKLVQVKQYGLDKAKAHTILPSKNGEILLIGNFIVKVAKDESIKWAKSYNYAGKISEIIDAKQTPDGGYILCGSISNNFDNNICLIKTDSTGTIEWSKVYGGSKDDIGNSIILTTDGGYLIAGTTRSYGLGSQDGFVLKTDSSGSAEWTKTYGGVDKDGIVSITHASNGNYLLAEFLSLHTSLIKTDSKGNKIWAKGIDSMGPCKVMVAPDGDYLVGGTIGSKSAAPGQHSYLLKTDTSGSVIWSKKYICDDLRDFEPTRDGGYALIGDLFFTNQGFYFSKTDATGNNGCASPPFSAQLTTDSLTIAAINFNNLNFKIYDSVLSFKPVLVPLAKIGDTSVCSLVTTAIENQETGNNLIISPNPSSTGIFNISFIEGDKELKTIAVYDMEGRKLFNEKTYIDNSSIDLSFCKKGIYIVRINSTSLSIQRKVNIQ